MSIQPNNKLNSRRYHYIIISLNHIKLPLFVLNKANIALLTVSMILLSNQAYNTL